MVNCDLCKSNYYSDDDPDTVCESKCKKMKTKEYTTEIVNRVNVDFLKK